MSDQNVSITLTEEQARKLGGGSPPIRTPPPARSGSKITFTQAIKSWWLWIVLLMPVLIFPIVTLVFEAITKTPFDYSGAIIPGLLEIPTQISKDAIPTFIVNFNFDDLGSIAQRYPFWNPSFKIGFWIAVALFAIYTFAVVKDDLSNIGETKAKSADRAAITAKFVAPLLYLFGTPVLGIIMSLSASLMMARDRNARKSGWYTLAIAGSFATIVLLMGYRYLAWSTMSWIGWYRLLIHMVMSIEASSGWGLVFIELIDLIFTIYLWRNPEKDASGQSWKWALGGFMTIVMGKIVFTNITGEVNPLIKNVVYAYVAYRFIMAIITESFEMRRAAHAKKATPITSFLSLIYTVLQYGLIACITWLIMGRAPEWAMLIAIGTATMLVGFIQGYTQWIVDKASNTSLYAAIKTHFDSLGDWFLWGPFMFYNAPTHLLLLVFMTAALLWDKFVTLMW